MKAFNYKPWYGKETGTGIGRFAEDVREKTVHLADLAKGKVRTAYSDTKLLFRKAVNTGKKVYEEEKSRLKFH